MFLIMFDHPWAVVDGSVKLDNYLEFMAVEIDDVVSDLMLSAKLEVIDLSISRQFPESIFGRGLVISKLFCSLGQTGTYSNPP